MHSIGFTIISVILFYCIPSMAADSSDCFKQQGDSYTKPSPGATRVSAGLACPESQKQDCSLDSGGFVNAKSTLNVTTNDAAMVYNAVAKATRVSFVLSTYGSAPNVTFKVKPGQIGYAAFTLFNRCYAGVLDGCIADISKDKVIEACQPILLSGKSQNLDGTSTFVQSDQKTIANMTTNPAANAPNGLLSDIIPSSQADKLRQEGRLSLTIMVALGLAGWLFF